MRLFYVIVIGGLLFYDVEEFDFEDECLAWTDEFACTTFAVSELVRDVEDEFRAYRHELEAFCPTCDYAIEREFDWFATLH